jgi:catechol 2,3-dioxygenase-like lactoylglutathione lyase family enzyme
MNRPVISAIGHVAMRVRDLDACVSMATDIMGLVIRGERGDAVDLTHGAPRHSLQYIGGSRNALDHIGLETPDVDTLNEVRRRVELAGLRIVDDGPLDDGLEHGLVFEGPAEVTFEVYCGMPHEAIAPRSQGVRPNRLGHVNYTPQEVAPTFTFLSEVLDFRISDAVIGGYFLRCNVEHHGIAVLPGNGQFHHYAWEVPGLEDLRRLCDQLNDRGESVLWGPVRHGCGNNIAVYFQGADGAVVEYYCDMARIYDDQAYKPREWDLTDHKWYSLWSPALPEGFVERGVAIGSPVGTPPS